MEFNFLKYFKKEADAQEVEQVNLWRKESQSNLDYLNQIQGIHHASEEMKGYRSFDVDAAYSKVTSSDNGSRKNSFNLNSWAAAASFLIIASCLAFFLSQVEDANTTVQSFATTDSLLNQSLSDGSFVTLDDHSSIEVTGREVTLMGRAFFNVTKKDDKAPFTVKFSKGKVIVLGTQFSIRCDKDDTEIAVVEGHVRYEFDNRSIDLFAGDIVRLIGNDIVKTSSNVLNVVSWKARELVFKDTNIEEVVSHLKRHYKIDIEIRAKIDKSKCRITTRFTDESIDDAMKELSNLLGLSYHTEGEKIVITSSKC